MWTPGGELVWKKFEEPRDSQESFGPGASKTDLQLWKEPGARDRVARRHLHLEESQSVEPWTGTRASRGSARASCM